MPCEIYTCQMSLMKKYPELQAYAVDITVKSGNRAFAPTWDIVMAIKNGTISEDEYIRRYRELMRKSYVHNRKAWKDLLSRRLVILMCYCSTNMFCHRHLLAEY